MINENYICMISYSDFENIKKMIYNDIKSSEGLTVSTRTFLKINEAEYDRLESAYGENGNKNYSRLVFMDKKQQLLVGKYKNVQVNLFACEMKDGYSRVIEDPVINNIPLFNNDCIVIDTLIESYNENDSYTRNLFSMYRDLFERFFPASYAEPLALLTTLECFGGNVKNYINIIWQEDIDLPRTHCTENSLCKLLKDTINEMNNCTYVNNHPSMSIYRKYLEKY